MNEPRQGGSRNGGWVRCAIYTRKSSEEGLEQEFNSLDAQREACEAYIKSQKHEGWRALPALYDDPGYSGGTMERPALQRLLADIAARKIDAVVVYKVDRLTRSLSDFAKIVEAFDARGVSFVSVTQAFNTTTSMGRLTLNVLLSFAQFEREVTGERIRDKIAASKKKGIWMGGLPSLGYDVKDRKLVINEAEAGTVRRIFRRYVELGSVRALKAELDQAGVVSKVRKAADGTIYGGKSFSRGALYLLLQNRIYRGYIVHKGVAHPGEHLPIIEKSLWDEVHSGLKENRVDRRTADQSEPNLLTGCLFDGTGEPMTPTHAVKKGTRYRYYVSRRLIVGGDSRKADGQRIPSANLESLVVERLQSFIADPIALFDTLPRDQFDAASQKKLREGAAKFLRDGENQPGASFQDLLRSFVTRVQVFADRIDVRLDVTGMAAWLAQNADSERSHPTSAIAHDSEGESETTLTIPAQLKRTGKELKFVVEGNKEASTPNASLIRVLARAHLIAQRLRESADSTLEEIAAEENMVPSYATRLFRLTFLAPDIVAAILAGEQPAELTANKLMTDTRLPLDWREQRAFLGFRQV